MMILDIPNKMFNMSQQQLMGYFRNLAVLNGSTNVFLATQDKDVFRNCVKHFKYGSLADLIYYQNKDDKHIIMYEAPEMPKTSYLFKKPKISMNLASISINKRKIYEEKLNNDEDNFDEPKKNQIRILLKRVGKKPLVKVINNTLEEKQKLVGGLIEVVDFDDNNLLICNEEGKVANLKPNLGFDLDYIAGDCFLIGDDSKNNTFKSIDLKEIKPLKKVLSDYAFNYEKEPPSKEKEHKEREL